MFLKAANFIATRDSRLKLSVFLVFDGLLAVGSLLVAFAVLGELPAALNWRQWLLIVSIPVFLLTVFMELGVYYTGVRFLDARVLWGIIQGIIISYALWTLAVIVGSGFASGDFGWNLPLLGMMITATLIGSSRLFGKWAFGHMSGAAERVNRVLVLGVGERSRELLRVISLSADIEAVGYLRVETAQAGSRLDGMTVYGLGDVDALLARYAGLEILTTDSSALAKRDEVAQLASKRPNLVRYVPNLDEMAGRRLARNQSRPINILDLLGREEHLPQPSSVGPAYDGQVVLVTGAAGTIGSELCKQLLDGGARKVIALDSSELGLYQLQQEMFWVQAGAAGHCELANIRDTARLKAILHTHNVEFVFHAAAHKHVNVLQTNPSEALTNNILGTLNLLKAVSASDASQFVMISSDKAVNPQSVMGASKRWCELLVRAFAAGSKAKTGEQKYCSVRFGNVLGSSGSVIPLFEKQIARGGPVTITDPEVVRFFMSTKEAARLVLSVTQFAKGGEVFTLDMGHPIKIIDMARQMISLAGLTPNEEPGPGSSQEIKIEVVGLRPGEKLKEELFLSSEHVSKTPDQKIFVASQPDVSADSVLQGVASLKTLAEQQDISALASALMDVERLQN